MPVLAQPLDRTKTEHVGIVDRILWCDADAGRLIVALTDGFAAVGPGTEEQFHAGTKVRFLGRWGSTPKYGYQFKFSTFVADVPASRKGQIDYLVKYAPNVGQITAEKLCDKYHYEAVRTLRERPELVAADEIMRLPDAQEAAAALAAVVALERTKIDLFDLFKGRGFYGTAVDAAIAAWGAKAPRVIRRNPFALLVRDIPGAGFKRCDRLWQELGLPPNALKRQMLCGWAALKDDPSGHTWLRGEVFVEAVKAAIPVAVDPRRAILLGLRAGWLRKRRDAAGVLWLAQAEKAIAEERVADRVRTLAAGRCLWPTELPVSVIEGDGLPSQHQHDTALAALARPFGILAGSPGTGKTHSLAFILRQVIERHGADAIAVCAPTGKAAVRATQSLQRLGLPLKATTIHQLLGIGRNGHDGQGWGFVHCRDNALPQRFIVVDESSMIDTSLLADLLDATTGPVELPAQPELVIAAGQPVPPRCLRCGRTLTDPESWKIGYGPECKRHVDEGQCRELQPEPAAERVVIPAAPALSLPGTHVLLVGDENQLPPVGHGAPLRDLIAAGTVAYGELSEIRRNAGLIVEACRSIKAGEPFASAERVDLDAGQNLLFIETPDDERTLEMLGKVLSSMTRFDPVWQTQVLVPLNKKSRLAREPVNDRLRGLLNPGDDALAFRPGDKVICLRNSRVVPHMPDPGRVRWEQPIEGPRHYMPAGDEEFLANGETGRVLCVDHQWAVVRFREDQPGDELTAKVWLPKKRRGEDRDGEAGTADNFDLAYAVTVHKAQGSEAPCIIVLIDDAGGRVAGREWLYTAVSRASKLCILIGKRDTSMKQIRQVQLDKRQTFLTELLKGESK